MLRSFQRGDAAAVWTLHDAALDHAGVHGGRGPWQDDLVDIAATYLESGGEFLVGLAGTELVAMGGLLRKTSAKAEIKRMRVHPDFQRRGLGRLVLEELEARARALGYREIRLDTTEEQILARRLYESAGYRETGRRSKGRFLFIDYSKSLGSTAVTTDTSNLTRPPAPGEEHPGRDRG